MFQNKFPKHPLASVNQKDLCIQEIKSNRITKTDEKFWYGLLKSIFITVKIIRRSSDHAVISWVYMNYKLFLDVETYDIIMETQNRICFGTLIQ